MDLSKCRSLILGCAGLKLTSDEVAFFKDANPLGFILFARNVQDPEQLSNLTAQMRSAVGWNAPVLIDQEGGRVQRMRAPNWPEYPAALDHSGCNEHARSFWLRGRLIAHDLNGVGIDVNCAPLADIARSETHPFLKNRCYGTTVEQVRANAQAMIDGQNDGGVASVFKHIPGHGLGTVDSHKSLPTVTQSHEILSQQDFAAFRSLTDVHMGMTAHIVYSEIDDEYPATQSTTMIDIIRSEIGFDGLLMTDDLSMNALKGDVVTRCRASLDAGCDIGLHCNGDMAEMISLANSTPMLSKSAVARAERALQARRGVQDVDIEALKAEFHTLTGG